MKKVKLIRYFKEVLMNRNRLLGLFLFMAIIIPQPSQAQLGGYYHMVSVYIDYTYVVREMTENEDPGNGYAVTASWPSAASPVYTHELLSFDVGDTIAVVPVPLVNPFLLQAYGVDLYLNLSEEGDMFISGTYPTIGVEDCSTSITIPPVEDPATYQLGGEPIVDEAAGTATWGFGIVTSGIFANQMYAPDLNVEEEGVDFGIGTERTCWGMITAQYDASFERIESAEVYWEAADGVETTLGVDTEGNLNRTFGVTGAFGDYTTIPYLSTLNPAINVGTYPMIGGPGADVNGDGSIDGDDGFIPNPELEWGYIFDPNGGDGAPFTGDEPLQFTGYYFTGNFLAAAGALAATFGQFSDPAILIDADGDGVPDTHPWIVYYMQLGLDQVSALVMTADSLANLGMQGLCVALGQSALAPVLGPVVGDYAGATLTTLLTGGVGTVDALTQTGAATGVYALGALAGAGVNVNDSDHDYDGTNGRLVFQVGNVCIPRNQHLEVNAYWVNTAAGVDVDPDESMIPKKFALYDNFPNPFNPTTQIAVDLPEAASTKITVWNIMGQKVATLHSGDLSAGHHVVNFDGRDQNGKQLTSGMYFYRVKAGKYNAIKKMTLLK